MGDRETPSIVLAAAYGGHAGYAYAVALELAKMGFKNTVILVAEGFEFIAKKFHGLGEVEFMVLPRRPGERLVKGLGRWLKAFYQSTRLVMRKRPGVVFASGSNFSIPPSFVAKLLKRTEVYTLEAIEHFTVPSRAVKIIEKLGGKVFLHWEEQLSMYPRGLVVGPVFEPALYEPRDEGYVLVTTGTLGFKQLYDAVERLGFERVVLQTGDVDPEPYRRRNPSWVVFRYTEDIHKWIAGASIVITQQGLTASVASLAYGKPVIIVWNPRVVLGAPKKDVEKYADKIGAVFLEEPDAGLIRKSIEGISRTTRNFKNGAGDIAKILVEELEKLK